jgi:hypothetical protein
MTSSSPQVLIDYSAGMSLDVTKKCHFFDPEKQVFTDENILNCDETRKTGKPVNYICRKKAACC